MKKSNKNKIVKNNKELEALSREDIKKITNLAKDPNIYRLLANSIAPKVYGFDKIKETILLQLFGSAIQKDRRNSINVLLVGDPAVAKSMILESVSEIASNKEVVCLDNIDRMSNKNKKLILFDDKKSILATADPRLGRFDPYTPIPEQIRISPVFLSCFDIIFVIRDIPSKSADKAIASFILEGKDRSVKKVIEDRIIKKYLFYARQEINPILTNGAKTEIRNFYIKIRNSAINGNSEVRPVPIAARQLGSLIRLSEANAKIRLSNKVNREDAKKTIEILMSSLRQIGYDEDKK